MMGFTVLIIALKHAEPVHVMEIILIIIVYLVPNEEKSVRMMMEMFKPKLATAIDSGNESPITVADYMERAMRVEYHLAQVNEKVL